MHVIDNRADPVRQRYCGARASDIRSKSGDERAST
jgi:hypothetical protein